MKPRKSGLILPEFNDDVDRPRDGTHRAVEVGAEAPTVRPMGPNRHRGRFTSMNDPPGALFSFGA